MAARMPNLKAFVHVSTAYVNGNQSKGSVVPEAMLPLTDQSNAHVSHAAVVANLQAVSKPTAAQQVSTLLQECMMLCILQVQNLDDVQQDAVLCVSISMHLW